MRTKEEKYKVEYIVKRIDEYRKETDIPIFTELCDIEDWTRSYIYKMSLDYLEIAEAIERLNQKKEASLERKGLEGQINTRFGELSLNQLGWSEKHKLDITVDDSLSKNYTLDELRKILNAEETDN